MSEATVLPSSSNDGDDATVLSSSSSSTNGDDDNHYKSVVQFTGLCQKVLKGRVIIWDTDDKHLMGKQYHAFMSHLIVACGHISMEVSISMKQLEAVTILHFRPVLPVAYATADATDKAYYNDILKLDMKKAADRYSTFQQDWYCMFNRILGQLCPMMVQQLQRSKSWEVMEQDSDPAKLMKLIRKVCLHGGDNAYVPDTFIAAIKELFTRKQGLQTPAEYDEQVGSNLDVLCDFVKLPPGTALFSMFPIIQEHVVNTFDEYTFDHADLTTQPKEIQKSVALKCDEVVMGCLITNNSNQSRSDLLKESRRALLAGQQDAYPTSRVEAMDRLVGYEAIKNQEVERSALYQQHKSERAAHSMSGNNTSSRKSADDGIEVDPITTAVFAHLGYLQYANTDDESSEQASDASIEGDTVESHGNVREKELDMEAMCFHQATSSSKVDDDGIKVDPITTVVFAHQGYSQYAYTDDESSEQASDVSIEGDTVESHGNVREIELDMEAMCFYQVADFRLGQA